MHTDHEDADDFTCTECADTAEWLAEQDAENVALKAAKDAQTVRLLHDLIRGNTSSRALIAPIELTGVTKAECRVQVGHARDALSEQRETIRVLARHLRIEY